MALVWGAAMPAVSRADAMYSITSLGSPYLADPGSTVDPTSQYPFNISYDGRVGYQLDRSNSELSTSWSLNSGGYSVERRYFGPTQIPNYYSGISYLHGADPRPDLLLPPGATGSQAEGVSSTGSVVGNSDSKSMPQFVYTVAQGFVNMNTSNLNPSTAQGFGGPYNYGINAQNDVVGAYAFGNFGKFGLIDHAFIASLGPSSPFYGGVDLNSLLPAASGWTLTSATGISDSGQIVGYGSDPSGKYSAYELTPSSQVPEPSVLAFLGTLCAGMTVRVAARRCRGRKGARSS
jgi:hypothetical protein